MSDNPPPDVIQKLTPQGSIPTMVVGGANAATPTPAAIPTPPSPSPQPQAPDVQASTSTVAQAPPPDVVAKLTNRQQSPIDLPAWAGGGTNPNADVDYSSGVGFMPKVALEGADNPQEARKSLELFFPKEDVGQDTHGNWTVKINGRRTAVMPRGNVKNWLSNQAASLLAGAPELEGAVGGAAVASELGPEAALARIGMGAIGAGIGSMFGYGSQEFVKSAQGTRVKNAQQEAQALANTGEAYTIGEASTPLAASGFHGLLNALRRYVGVTPEIAERQSRLWAEGLQRNARGSLVSRGGGAPIKSILPEAKAFQAKERLDYQLFGDTRAPGNRAIIENRLKNTILPEAGIPPDQINDIMTLIARGTPIPSTDLGQALVGAMRARETELAKTVEDSVARAAKSAHTQEALIKEWAYKDLGRLGKSVGDEIIAQRQLLSARFQEAYNNISAMTGNAPVFPMDGVIQAAQRIEESTAPAYKIPLISNIANMNLGENFTIAQAQALRSSLRHMLESRAMSAGLTPGMDYSMISDMEDAIDTQFEQLETSPELAGDAARLLRNTDKEYGKAIQPFKNAQINHLVGNLRGGAVPDAEKIAAEVTKNGYVEQTQLIKSMVSPEVWDSVKRADMRNMLMSASRQNDKGEWEIDGKSLARILNARKNILPTIYGADFADYYVRSANNLAAVDGKITDLSGLDSGIVKRSLTKALKTKIELDLFAKANPIRALLSSSDTELFDSAANSVIKPGAEAVTEHFASILGQLGDPQIWENVQKYALWKVMEGSLQRDASGTISVNGNAMIRNLNAYTPRQIQLLFPGDRAEIMRQLAEDTNFLFPQMKSSTGIGLKAAMITLNVGLPLSHVSILADKLWATWRLSYWIDSRPGLARFIVNESHANPEVGLAIGRIVRQAALTDIMQGPGRKKENGVNTQSGNYTKGNQP